VRIARRWTGRDSSRSATLLRPPALELAERPLRKAVPDFLPRLIAAFIPLDSEHGGRPQRFTD
jgi:hypothetical protein